MRNIAEPPFDTTTYRRLSDEEPCRAGDRWFDQDDGKWWEFQSVNCGLCARDYHIVIRKKETP